MHPQGAWLKLADRLGERGPRPVLFFIKGGKRYERN
jgi:hypothetical protein